MNFTDDDVHAAFYCAVQVVQSLQVRGQPIPPELRRHFGLDLAIECMSPLGHETDSDAPQLNPEQWIATREAAKILDHSPRHTRRIAPDLGARIIGGRLLFPRSIVENYTSERQTA